MTVTARYMAWLESFKPTSREHISLAAMETALLLAWTFLLDSLLRLFTSMFLNAAPLFYIIAANLLAGLEDSRISSAADPLAVLGLAELDRRGRRPARWRTLIRLLLTPPAFLILMAGILPVLRGRRSLPEVAAGVKLYPLDPSLDPRPLGTILAARARNRKTVITYTLFSLAIAALFIAIPLPRGHYFDLGPRDAATGGMSAQDRQLLSYYLDEEARYPDSLEFHVRLASLYYRNAMQADLAVELGHIARLDPESPMLLLGGDMSVDINGLIQPGDSFPELDELGFGPDAGIPGSDSTSADSTAGDSTAAPGPGQTEAGPVRAEEPAPELPDSQAQTLPDSV
jgi:hypothetical protein